MKQISLISNTTTALYSEELQQINGGTFESGAAAGESVGQAVRKAIDDWGILDAAWKLAKYFL